MALKRTIKLLVALVCLLLVGGCGTEQEPQRTPWEEVQDILAATRDIIVLDGTHKAPLRTASKGESQFGDWMVQHMLSDPENLNPYTSNDAGASQVLSFVFESLLYPEDEPPYVLKGMLAEEYPTISQDKLSYSFAVRRDARFADGQPLTAADVLFSLKVVKNPQVLAPHLRNYFAAVEDVQVQGEYGITITCSEPYFLNDVMLGGLEIIPRHFYDPEGLMEEVTLRGLVDGSWKEGADSLRVSRFAQQFNQNFNRKVLGSGSYLIEDIERDVVTQQKVVLTRNSNYWGTGKADLQDPGYVDKIVFKIVNNMDAAFIDLKNGNLDVHRLQPLEFKDKSWSPEFTDHFLKGIQYSSGYVYVGWNNDHPIFGDRRVRQAMTHLIDKDDMVANLLFGLGESVEGPIHKFRPEYNNDLKPYGYDRERAVALLQEAGWEDADGDGVLDIVVDGERIPFVFVFLVNSGNQIRKDIALVVQSELHDVGIECEVRELDWSIFLDRVKNKNFDAVTLGWTGSLRFPPDNYQIWHSSQAEGNGSNFIRFINPEVDRILEEYRQEFDMEKRIALYRRYQEILYEEQPYTFLWKQRTVTAYSRRYEGVNWYPAGTDNREWWVSPANRLYQ